MGDFSSIFFDSEYRTYSPGPISLIWEYFPTTLEIFGDCLRDLAEMGARRFSVAREKARTAQFVAIGA